MLKVATIIKPSLIDGYGLFAAQDIKRGELIWRFDAHADTVLEFDEIDSLSEKIRDLVTKRGSCEGGFYLLMGDGAAFINHSLSPNTESVAQEPNCDTIASHDIAIGEEITEDYRSSQSYEALDKSFW